MSDDSERTRLFDLELDRLEALGSATGRVTIPCRSHLGDQHREFAAVGAKLGATWPCGWPDITRSKHGEFLVFEDVHMTPDEAEGIGAKLIEMAGVARRGES